MTNAPTESEFDKELDHIMGWCSGIAHSPCWYDENIIGKNLTGYDEDMLAKEAIKRAVDKHVIGDPINVHSRSNLYASKPGTEGLEQKWYDLGTNGRVEEQRKALYGGDKK